MRKKVFLSNIVPIFIFSIFFSMPIYASETYTFDPAHTYVIWQVNHFGFSDLTGKFMASGTLVLDESKPQNSKVNVKIDTANISTAIPKLDSVLRGSNFFDTQKYPSATFVSNKIEMTGKMSGKVYGTLTIRGIAKTIILNVKLTKAGVHPYYGKRALGFTAETTLKRSAFGLSGYIPGVGDETKIQIQAEAEITNTSVASHDSSSTKVDSGDSNTAPPPYVTNPETQ